MTFWKIFWSVAPFRPAEAITALWWHLTRRRVRAKNVLKAAAAELPLFYRWWIQDVEQPRLAALIRDPVASQQFAVLILPGDDSVSGMKRSLLSVRRQTSEVYTVMAGTAAASAASLDGGLICLTGKARNEGELLAEALMRAASGFLVPLRAGDVLAPSALSCLQQILAVGDGTVVAFGDHDHLDGKGNRHRPWFKPAWDEDHFLAQDYISRACALSVPAAIEACGGPHPPRHLFELIVKMARDHRDKVVHVPQVLVHADATLETCDAGTRAEAVRCQHAIEAERGPFGTVRVRRALPSDLPPVTIIIPTKDKVELVESCVRSVLEKTTYPAFDIIIVDNGSADPGALSFLRKVEEDPRVRVLSAPIPYNFSALNNLAVEEARGDFVCLLNNDTEIVEPDWLTAMMRHAVRPDVGAVGAKLLYPDGSIQHAGVVVGMGDAAGHVHRFSRNDESVYFAQAHVTRSVTAVTAACLLVAKDKYRAVGGLDEKSFAIAYNDIDFCLKLRKAGWRNVYVAEAVLLHHESKSRAKDNAPSQIERYSRELAAFQTRWQTRNFVDPAFSPNLDRNSECVVVSFD